jgi:hypothetical protein
MIMNGGEINIGMRLSWLIWRCSPESTESNDGNPYPGWMTTRPSFQIGVGGYSFLCLRPSIRDVLCEYEFYVEKSHVNMSLK